MYVCTVLYVFVYIGVLVDPYTCSDDISQTRKKKLLQWQLHARPLGSLECILRACTDAYLEYRNADLEKIARHLCLLGKPENIDSSQATQAIWAGVPTIWHGYASCTQGDEHRRCGRFVASWSTSVRNSAGLDCCGGRG